MEYPLDTSFNTIYDIVCNEYTAPEIFHMLVKIDRFISLADMTNIIQLVFDSFRTVYMPEETGGNGSRSIDYKQDYSVIWDTLKTHRNVDLNKDDISWIEFQNLLHGVLLEGKGSLCKVLEFRAYEKPPEGKNAHKLIEQKQHEYRMEMKNLYRIRCEEDIGRKELSTTLHSIMDFMKSKR